MCIRDRSETVGAYISLRTLCVSLTQRIREPTELCASNSLVPAHPDNESVTKLHFPFRQNTGTTQEMFTKIHRVPCVCRDLTGACQNVWSVCVCVCVCVCTSICLFLYNKVPLSTRLMMYA